MIPLGTWGGFKFVLGSKRPLDQVSWAEIAPVFFWLLSLLTALYSSSLSTDGVTRFLSNSLQPLLPSQLSVRMLGLESDELF